MIYQGKESVELAANQRMNSDATLVLRAKAGCAGYAVPLPALEIKMSSSNLRLIAALVISYFPRELFREWIKWDYSPFRDGWSPKVFIDILIWLASIVLSLLVVNLISRIFQRQRSAG